MGNIYVSAINTKEPLSASFAFSLKSAFEARSIFSYSKFTPEDIIVWIGFLMQDVTVELANRNPDQRIGKHLFITFGAQRGNQIQESSISENVTLLELGTGSSEDLDVELYKMIKRIRQISGEGDSLREDLPILI